MPKRVIVFDMDGVLFDSIAMVHEYIAGNFLDVSPEDIFLLNEGNFHEEIQKVSWKKREYTPEEAEARKISFRSAKAKTPLFPGIHDLLLDLSRKYILAINTSAGDMTCLPLLDHAGIRPLFSFIGTKAIAVRKVDKFLMIAEKFGCSAKDMVFVTDTVGDIRESGEAGVATIAVTWGAQKKEHFLRSSYSHVVSIVETVSELGRVLDEFFTRPKA